MNNTKTRTIFGDLRSIGNLCCFVYLLLQQRLTSRDVVDVSAELARLTSPSWKLSAEEITFTARTLENILSVNKTDDLVS